MSDDGYEVRFDMDRVLLRAKAELDLSPWEAVRLAHKLLDAADCAQSEIDSEDASAAAGWSSSLFPASEIEVGDCVGGYEVASVVIEPDMDGRLTVMLLTDRGSRMTTFFEPTDSVPLEKSR